MPLVMPNPKNPESIEVVVARLMSDKVFALDFATEVKNALGGNAAAIACVQAYFQPTDKELASFGIPVPNNAAMRACTDLGEMIVLKCKEAAPQVFP